MTTGESVSFCVMLPGWKGSITCTAKKQHEHICIEASKKEFRQKDPSQRITIVQPRRARTQLHLLYAWAVSHDQNKNKKRYYWLSLMKMHCKAPYATLYNCHGCVCACSVHVGTCWRARLKENEGQRLMRVWIFLIIASYLSRLSSVSCTPRAAKQPDTSMKP